MPYKAKTDLGRKNMCKTDYQIPRLRYTMKIIPSPPKKKQNSVDFARHSESVSAEKYYLYHSGRQRESASDTTAKAYATVGASIIFKFSLFLLLGVLFIILRRMEEK